MCYFGSETWWEDPFSSIVPLREVSLKGVRLCVHSTNDSELDELDSELVPKNSRRRESRGRTAPQSSPTCRGGEAVGVVARVGGTEKRGRSETPTIQERPRVEV